MGRLIDADALKQNLRKCQIESLIAHTEEKNVFDIINEQPTAYDVEKVEEQIEEMFGVDPMYYGTEAMWAVDKAIDIVKRGGVE